MKISYSWLKEYIDIDMTPEDLGAILTDIGLEVSNIEYYESIKGGLDGLVIGHVQDVVKHPDADRLSVCRVDVGREVLDIVCGAPNVAQGQKVVVAPVGTTLYPIDSEPFQIKRAKIRGVESKGMICAEDEIGIGTSHDGIIVLDDHAESGRDAVDYFDVYKDYVIEIDLTPNRVDAASHIGVARDLSAYLNQFKETKIDKPSVDDFKPGKPGNSISVEIVNPQACPRYSGLTIKNVEIKESPEWLQNKLKAIGLKPINNIVDITNFVLFETGHPLHAFNADKIKGNKVIVKQLPENTEFVTLDEEKHKLSAEDLMICNEEEGMCIAGVFGGMDSGVTAQTTNIFIESAYFNPVYVRKTAKRHGLSTDSSFRFERGADPDITIYALKRAALLIQQYAGGEIVGDIVDEYPEPAKKHMIELLFANLDRLVGNVIEKERVKKILKALEVQIVAEKEIGLLLEIPTYRVDVTREADVVEEILRIYGYNNIETSSLVNSSIQYSQKPNREKLTNVISDMLSGSGFFEIISNSLTKSSYYRKISCFPEKNCVCIFNPLSQDLNCMRQTLLFGGLEAVMFNINRKNNNLKFYEFGNCYFLNPEKNSENLKKYDEEKFLSLFLTGLYTNTNWISKEKPSSFYTLKTIAFNVLKKLGIDKSGIRESVISTDIYSEGIEIFAESVKLAEIGVVSEILMQEFDIKTPVYYANIHWDKCLKVVENHSIGYKPVPKYPEVRRDLAILLDNHILYKDIEHCAYETEPRLLKHMSLFDVYTGDKLEKGKKSYAIAFYLQDKNKTLTDKHIDKTMNKFIRNFKTKFNVQIR